MVKNKKTSSHAKNILIYSAIAGLLMFAILNVFILDSTPVETDNDKEVAAVTAVDSSATIEPPNSNTVKKSKSDSIANSLFNNSQQQILLNNYGAALMSVNNALKEDPQHEAARLLKKKIEFEFKVRAYLGRAEKFLAQGKLTKPANDNAFLTYTELANLLPSDDKRASDGLLKVADSYYRLANDAALNKQFDIASKYISTGLTVIPDYPLLKQLEPYITRQQWKLQEQQRIEAERLEEQQKAAKLKQQKRQQLLEQQRLAKLRQEQQRKIQQQNELEKNRQIRIENKKIDRMMSEARVLLRRNSLTSESLIDALEIHGELTTSTVRDTRIPDLFQQIIESYGKLARTQQEAPNLPEALSTINQGLALDKNNTRLLRIKQDIESLISEAEKKK